MVIFFSAKSSALAGAFLMPICRSSLRSSTLEQLSSIRLQYHRVASDDEFKMSSIAAIICLMAAFGLGYWFGYACGQQDAADGIREP